MWFRIRCWRSPSYRYLSSNPNAALLLCTGHYGRHINNHRARACWRAWRDEALKTTATDRDVLDYVAQYAEAW